LEKVHLPQKNNIILERLKNKTKLKLRDSNMKKVEEHAESFTSKREKEGGKSV